MTEPPRPPVSPVKPARVIRTPMARPRDPPKPGGAQKGLKGHVDATDTNR